ncbi:MAG: metallophosphatase family protein [Bacteroidales bacterium]|nr:metallophosphatase family protein [Bacteroidales bacterium]
MIASLPHAILLRGNHDDLVGSGEIDPSVNRFAREAIAWTIEQLNAEERAWLRQLVVDARGESWVAVHGSPCCPDRFSGYVYELTYESNLDTLAAARDAVCFHGHSHIQFVYLRTADGTVRKSAPASLKLFVPDEIALVNPGSVGQPRDGDPRTAFAVWDRKANTVTFHREEYALEETLQAIRAAGLAEDLALRLEIGR